MTVKTMGLDIARHVFQVHGANASGKTVLKKRLRRNQLTDFFGSIPACLVAMEATRGAHYWARVIGTFGHQVRLIAPQFVKPYLRGQKNDTQDAAAICEAASRPEMRFVPQKSIHQQDLQMLHRIRSRLVGSRTQLGNQVRGLLAEYGIVVPLHMSQLRKQLVELTAETHPQLTPFAQDLFVSLYEELCSIDERLDDMERRIQQAFQHKQSQWSRKQKLLCIQFVQRGNHPQWHSDVSKPGNSSRYRSIGIRQRETVKPHRTNERATRSVSDSSRRSVIEEFQ